MPDIRSLDVRDEIMNLSYEPAVNLGDVVKGSAPGFIGDPVEFFGRTHVTDSMKSLVIKAFMNLLGIKSVTVSGKQYNVSSSLILLPSDLGGGKTHSLILLYHIFKLVNQSGEKDDAVSKLEILDKDIAELVSRYWEKIKSIAPKIVVADCRYSDLAPGPARPIRIAGREIKTLWGYLGYELGKYEVVEKADSMGTAPYVDDLLAVLDGSRAIVLIDEIGRYYDMSGLEPTKVSVFLMNLAEALSKYTVREVAVVISVPYDVEEKRVEAGAGMEYIHKPELVRAINKVLNRPNVEIVKPVRRFDLAEILQKRIFRASNTELDQFATEFISRELSREYPVQVRKVLDDRGFWREVRKTYPFHPMFLNVLEKLSYGLGYLQKTRDAIKIAVQTVLALKEGLFDALEDEISLVMPYHIPIFVSETLDETILRNAPNEYLVFNLILKNNVVIPHNFTKLKKLGKEGFYKEVIARELRNLKEDEMKLGVKLASIIWLHSLIGLGLPMNIGDYPTTIDLIYSVSPTDQDVKGVLNILRSILPQLIIHGEPDSDTTRWFFTRIPSIDDLIDILKKNVTDEMAKDKLAEFLEWGLLGKKGRGRPPKEWRKGSTVFSSSVVVKSVRSVPGEVSGLRDPVLVVFADIVPGDELLGLLKGRNNLIALAPSVIGVSEMDQLAPEDIAGIRELAGLEGKSVWDGLLEILRYYIATEHISEANLKSFVGDIVGKGEEEYLKDLLELLKNKVDSKKDYFYKNTWNMINRSYRRVYYHRLGRVFSEEGVSLESDKPIPVIVEEFLRDKKLIPEEFKGTNIESIVKNYLNKDPKKDPIGIGELWTFILSTDKAKVPLVAYKDFINAVKDLIKSMDYAVRIDGEVLWKPIFKSEVEAETTDEGSKLVGLIAEYLRRLGKSWDDVQLVYWENVFDEWLNKVTSSIPDNKVLKIKDRSGRILDIRDVKFSLKDTIKSGKLFYEEKKYPVEIKLNIPEEMLEGKEYVINAEITVKNFDEEFNVKLIPDNGLSVEPREFKGRSPLSVGFKIRAEKAGDYQVAVKVHSGDFNLDSRVISIPVKGEWIEKTLVIGDKGESVDDDARVVAIIGEEINHLAEISRVAKSFPGSITGKLTLSGEAGVLSLNIDTDNADLLELTEGHINSIRNSLKMKTADVYIEYAPSGELRIRDITSVFVNPKGLKVKFKVKAGGSS
ncbi:MAG: ATP-binding protein [Desulfurococcales archaeon]|nr:ATP-binding protein [Desulfurococcales archaeon]